MLDVERMDSAVIPRLLKRLIANMSDEMKAAYFSGCEMESSYDSEKGMYTMRTKYPVGFERDKAGRIVKVFQQGRGIF